MICPACLQDNDAVIFTGLAEGGTAIRRRRECHSCGRVSVTHERMDGEQLSVRKRDGRLQKWNRLQVLLAMERACHKAPVSSTELEDASRRIERQVRERFQVEVDATFIELLALEELEKLCPVAAIRWASVARMFTRPEQFAEAAACLTTT